jgi:hypothetical protein
MGKLKEYMEKHNISSVEKLSVILDVAPSLLRMIDKDPKRDLSLETIRKIHENSVKRFGQENGLTPDKYLDSIYFKK